MKEHHNIKETSGKYVVRDETTWGNFVQRWESTWDKELQLVSLKLGSEELVAIVTIKDTGAYHYHRAVRTKSRHLNMLKEHLGMPSTKKRKVVKKEETLIWLFKGYHSQLDELKFEEAIVHEKTLDVGWSRYKKHEIHHAPATTENVDLMNEYNERLTAFKAYQKEMFEKIFTKSEGVEIRD